MDSTMAIDFDSIFTGKRSWSMVDRANYIINNASFSVNNSTKMCRMAFYGCKFFLSFESDWNFLDS